MATRKSELWTRLKELNAKPEKAFIYWTEEELEALIEAALSSTEQDDFSGSPEGTPEDDSEAALEALAATLVGPPPEGTPPPPAAAPLSAPEPAPVPQASPAPARARVPQPRASQPQSRPAPRRPLAAVAPKTYEESIKEMQYDIAALARSGELTEGRGIPWTPPGETTAIRIPIQAKGADRAGLTHSTPPGQPIRVDLQGRIWFLDEVPKPSIPKPRMTRTQRYIDPGVKQEATYLPDGHLDEIYEVAGDSHRELTIKTTLQAFQVGMYRDPRFPFDLHSYNGALAFDFDQVNQYYGGLTLIPRSIKTTYVGGQLCYSIPTVRETIQQQYNALRRN